MFSVASPDQQQQEHPWERARTANSGPHPKSVGSETLGVGPGSLSFNNLSRKSKVRFENSAFQ